MIRKVIDYIKEDSFEVRATDQTISILNYTTILFMEEEKIAVSYVDGTVVVKGKNLTVVKLLDQEILIKGDFLSIEFRRYHE